MSTLLNALIGSTEVEASKEVKAVKEVKKDSVDYTASAMQAGQNIAKASKLQIEADKLKVAVNKVVMQLHAAEIMVGRKGKCAIATAFTDGMLDGGLSKGTAQNYLSVFREAVKSGIEVTDWNPSRVKVAVEADIPEEGEKSEVTKKIAKEVPMLSDALLKAFNFNGGEDFKKLCFDIEKQFEDAEIDNVYAGFISYLKFHGVEV